MTAMRQEKTDRFEILRGLATAAAEGKEVSATSRQALEQAAAYVNLSAAAMYLWKEDFEVTVRIYTARTQEHEQRLATLEENLFAQLRQKNDLLSAYMSFGGEAPGHSFTLPLKHGPRVFGAVIGFQEGERTLIAEDAFLEALSAMMALHHVAAGADATAGSPAREALDKERLGAIVETAVAVNHEVNNPLTAILGNVQLLLLKRESLDDDLVAKLRTIEASALKIKDVTQRLMRISSPRSVEYSEGTRMLDLSADEDSEKS